MSHWPLRRVWSRQAGDDGSSVQTSGSATCDRAGIAAQYPCLIQPEGLHEAARLCRLRDLLLAVTPVLIHATRLYCSMAAHGRITRFFAYRHLRSEASSSIIAFRRGVRTRSGRGLSFWFNPDRTSIMEIPADDRDTDFVFQARSRDYQVVTVQGTIT